MVLDYYPFGINKIDDFFEITYNKENKLDKIKNGIDDRFCTYVIDDKNDYLICGRKTRSLIVNNCCHEHLKYMHPDIYMDIKKTYYVKKNKNNIYYCCSKSRRKERCGMRVKNNGDFCYKHKNNKKDDIIFVENIKTKTILISDNCTYNTKSEDLNSKKDNKNTDLKVLIEHYKKIKFYIDNNKKYLYLKNDNKHKKYYYYKENYITKLLKSFNLRYEYLIDHISYVNLPYYERNSVIRILDNYKEDLDAYIIEFYNTDNKYNLYL